VILANYRGVKYQGKFKKDQLTKFLREHVLASSYKRKTRGFDGELKELSSNMVPSGPCSSSGFNMCLLCLFQFWDGTPENENLKHILINLCSQICEYSYLHSFTLDSSKIEDATSFQEMSKFPALLHFKDKERKIYNI